MNAITIARFTIQEAITRRLILAGVLLSLAFLALYALGASFLYGKAIENATTNLRAAPVAIVGTMLTLLGLYAVNFLSSFMALFLSVGAISGEIDSGALHAVLARPIRRAEYVFGRWLAYAGLICLYVGLMAGSLLLITYLIAGASPPEPARAVALMALSALLLLTLSLLGSTLFSTLANGVVVFSLFGLAWLAGIIEYLGTLLPNEGMVNLGIAVSLRLPCDAIWRGASYYVQSPAFLAAFSVLNNALPFASTTPPTPALVIWSALHPLVLLLAAIAAFSRRDL